MSTQTPQSQVFWYLDQLPEPACRGNHTFDVAVIGGGMAGLSAAHAFRKRGKSVAVLERYYCGAGASGKSSGFITPNAELSFTDFSKLYSPAAARQIWDFITSGVDYIRTNIDEHKFSCDYSPQDTLMVANSPKAMKVLEQEYHNLAANGYPTDLYTRDAARSLINSDKYHGGVSYRGTFGISAYDYCQEMKRLLRHDGVAIFEDTDVTSIDGHCLTTPHARVTADYIIVCTDRFMPELGLLTKEVYHAQNVLMISEPLPDAQVKAMFPQQKLMVWDSEALYNYFRFTPNNQFMIGGASFLTFYNARSDYEPTRQVNTMARYVDRTFPGLNIQFTQVWPGIVGVSKDIAPIAGRDRTRPYLYYVTAAAGLPIAAAMGRYSAEHLLDGRTDMDAYLSPYRSYSIGGLLQSIIGNKLSFALCHGIQKFL